jgi:hypothetical protein
MEDLSQEQLVLFQQELKKTISAPIKDIQRTIESDPNFISSCSGHWIKGHTAVSGTWLNYGLVYHKQILPNVFLDFPNIMNYLYKLRPSGYEMVGFSLLKSNSEIPPHKDNENSSISWHLGIDVPEKCFLKVEDEIHEEKNGKWVIFDDSRIHAAYNKNEKDRIILYCKP